MRVKLKRVGAQFEELSGSASLYIAGQRGEHACAQSRKPMDMIVQGRLGTVISAQRDCRRDGKPPVCRRGEIRCEPMRGIASGDSAFE